MKRIGDSEIKFINLEYAYKQHLRIACEQREKSRKRIEALEHDFKKVMAIKVVELDEAIKLQTCLMGEAFVERPKEPKIYGKSPIHSIKEDIEEFERIRKEPFTLKGKEIKIGWDFADGNKEDEDFYYKSDVDKVAEEICNNIEAKGVMSVDEKFIDADDVIEIVQRILGVKE